LKVSSRLESAVIQRRRRRHPTARNAKDDCGQSRTCAETRCGCLEAVLDPIDVKARIAMCGKIFVRQVAADEALHFEMPPHPLFQELPRIAFAGLRKAAEDSRAMG